MQSNKNMNSFAKFQKVQSKAGPSPSTSSGVKMATVSNANAADKKAIHERILTVDIKTMRKHMRDEKNFNNPQTILETFAKVQRISPSPEDSRMRQYQLTLKSFDKDQQPCFKMEADYFGNAVRSIQCEDDVRCMGRLIGQTGRFRIMQISKINAETEMNLIERLQAISSFELAKLT